MLEDPQVSATRSWLHLQQERWLPAGMIKYIPPDWVARIYSERQANDDTRTKEDHPSEEEGCHTDKDFTGHPDEGFPGYLIRIPDVT